MNILNGALFQGKAGTLAEHYTKAGTLVECNAGKSGHLKTI
jgi:hypothetical protein